MSHVSVVTYGDILDIPKINPSDKKNYWLIAVVLLSIACWPLLVVIAVKYCDNSFSLKKATNNFPATTKQHTRAFTYLQIG